MINRISFLGAYCEENLNRYCLCAFPVSPRSVCTIIVLLKNCFASLRVSFASLCPNRKSSTKVVKQFYHVHLALRCDDSYVPRVVQTMLHVQQIHLHVVAESSVNQRTKYNTYRHK